MIQTYARPNGTLISINGSGSGNTNSDHNRMKPKTIFFCEHTCMCHRDEIICQKFKSIFHQNTSRSHTVAIHR